jgi:hypothetical protein
MEATYSSEMLVDIHQVTWWKIELSSGSAITQVVGHWLLTAMAQVQF